MLLIKRVSDLTHFDWDRVWDMKVYDFLSYATFDIRYKKEEQKAIDEYKRTH